MYDIIQVFLSLSDGTPEEQKPSYLEMELNEQQRFITCFNYLSGLTKYRKGLTDLEFSEDGGLANVTTNEEEDQEESTGEKEEFQEETNDNELQEETGEKEEFQEETNELEEIEDASKTERKKRVRIESEAADNEEYSLNDEEPISKRTKSEESNSEKDDSTSNNNGTETEELNETLEVPTESYNETVVTSEEQSEL